MATGGESVAIPGEKHEAECVYLCVCVHVGQPLFFSCWVSGCMKMGLAMRTLHPGHQKSFLDHVNANIKL